GDVRWEFHPEAPPSLVLLPPWRDLGDFESGPGQREGDGQIGPHRIACKVDKVQIIPPGFPGMASESSTGIGALLNDSSLGGLDRNAFRREGRALVRKFERRERRALLVQIDGHVRVCVAQYPVPALQHPHSATENKIRGDGLELVEAIKTAMGCNRKTEKI